MSTALTAADSLELTGTVEADASPGPVEDVGSGNRGIFARNTELSGGEVMINGEAGRGKNRSEGVNMNRIDISANSGVVEIVGSADHSSPGNGKVGGWLTNVNVRATTSISVEGNGGDGEKGNGGLTILGSSFEALGSTLTVQGHAHLGGGNPGDVETGGSGHYGIKVSRTMFSAAGDIDIDARASRGGAGNYGLQLQKSTIVSEGADVSIDGRAIYGNTGKGNFGIRSVSTTISGAAVTLLGTGGDGTDGNHGLQFSSGSITATSGHALITGETAVGTTGSNNFGILMKKTEVSAGVDLRIDGEARGSGTNGNFGVHLSAVTARANEDARLLGVSNSMTSGRDNFGLFLDRSSLTTGLLSDIAGTGGGGSNGNYGVSIVRGAVLSGTTTDILGVAHGSTSGKGNSGVSIYNGVMLEGPTGLSIDGTGGGGTRTNYGVFMNKNITAPGANVTGTSTDGVSDDEAGDFFVP